MCQYCQKDIFDCTKILVDKNDSKFKGIIIKNRLQIKMNANLFEKGKMIAEFNIDFCPKCGEKLL